MAQIAYCDCFSGISGDMLLGALLDAGLPIDALRTELAKLGIKSFDIQSHKSKRKHLACTRFEVLDAGGQPLRHLSDLNGIVASADLPESVKTSASNIFMRIAKAEAAVHGTSLDSVHFHEIGAIDTIVDVVGALMGLRLMGVDVVHCSPLNVGTGMVEFSHGKWPVPAPATAEILKGIPTYSTDSQAELVTPTGAAIIAELATTFGPPPAMRVSQIGYGGGQRDLERPNVVRVMIGTSDDVGPQDEISVLETNIDDMNPEILGWVMERLFAAGALDVYSLPIGMKKNRPGHLLSVMTRPEDAQRLAAIILRETTSLGVRMRREKRIMLARQTASVDTRFGPVLVKQALDGDRIIRQTPEYEDCRRLALEQGVALIDVYNAALGGRPAD
ncbi:MAG: nickel pincer cofactor biosynthesis protein LarC [Verrucomicrobia bacterium]|nr:nickel pincer cofactor biosynthesis protein LarC [Verrucomicrobiota bacterium]